jgi:hypothetical protein
MRTIGMVLLTVVGAVALGSGLWVGATSGETVSRSRVGPAFGVSLDLPSGWIGRIYDGNRGASPPYASVQATSFAREGPGVLDPDSDTAKRVGEQMGSSDILVLLWEIGSGRREAYEPLAGAPQITREDFAPIEGFARPVAHTLFSVHDRSFDLFVEFGASPDAAQLTRANDVLATLRIEPRS